MPSNSNEIRAWLTGIGQAAPAAVVPALLRGGLHLQAAVQARASGRPGPYAQTGDYRRSWTTVAQTTGVSVGTNKVQGPRLEYGFTGTDSLGRRYNQPPYAHLEPAIQAEGDRILAIVGAAYFGTLG